MVRICVTWDVLLVLLNPPQDFTSRRAGTSIRLALATTATAMLIASASNPTYNENAVLPNTTACSGFNPSDQASNVTHRNPASQPSRSRGAVNHSTNSPNTTAGNVWRIHKPPNSCRSSANCVGR